MKFVLLNGGSLFIWQQDDTPAFAIIGCTDDFSGGFSQQADCQEDMPMILNHLCLPRF